MDMQGMQGMQGILNRVCTQCTEIRNSKTSEELQVDETYIALVALATHTQLTMYRKKRAIANARLQMIKCFNDNSGEFEILSLQIDLFNR
jgi:hypothetical protein